MRFIFIRARKQEGSQNFKVLGCLYPAAQIDYFKDFKLSGM